jgi:hypothetical protein
VKLARVIGRHFLGFVAARQVDLNRHSHRLQFQAGDQI